MTFCSTAASPPVLPDHVRTQALMGFSWDGVAGYLLDRFTAERAERSGAGSRRPLEADRRRLSGHGDGFPLMLRVAVPFPR